VLKTLEPTSAISVPRDTCPAIHSAFQGLEPVDLTLGLSITPAFADGILDGSEVMPNGVRKPAHAVQAGPVSIVQPGVRPAP
jgi:hypothetical protein